MKFEKPINQSSQKENDTPQDGQEKTILNKVRNSRLGQNLVRIGAAAAFLTGTNSPLKAENSNLKNSELKENLEIKNNLHPDSYAADKIIENFRSEKIKEEDLSIKEKVYNGIETSRFDLSDLILKKIEKTISDINLEISTAKNFLPEKDSKGDSSVITEKEKQLDYLKVVYQKKLDERNNLDKSGIKLTQKEEEILSNTERLSGSIEKTRQEILSIINSQEYLERLQKELECSKDEAEKHQLTRKNNVDQVILLFKSKEYLEAKYECQAYYDYNEHKIAVPYNIEESRLNRLLKHELWHAATMGDRGLPEKTKTILAELSVKQENKYYTDHGDKKYFLSPTERYVRLKVLDAEMERLGIKKVGEKLTRNHYNKMMEVFMSNFFNQSDDGPGFNQNAFDFILMTKEAQNQEDEYLIYDQLFNEIARQEIDKDKLNPSGDYRHPGWDYNNPENLA